MVSAFSVARLSLSEVLMVPTFRLNTPRSRPRLLNFKLNPRTSMDNDSNPVTVFYAVLCWLIRKRTDFGILFTATSLQERTRILQ